MAYWLVKSEPDVYSWDDLVRETTTLWTGVRNPVARNHLLAMKAGDLAFFYHSNVGKEIVGVAKVVGEAVPDPTVGPDKLAKDGRNPWVAVTVAPAEILARPVGLAAVKADPRLAGMALVTHSRLSVQPVTAAEWDVVRGLAGTRG